MKNRIFSKIALLLPLLVGVVACNNSTTEGNNGVPVTGITISGTGVNNGTLTVLEGSRDLTLNAAVRPSNATNKEVTWDSSVKSVATISNEGLLHIVGPGESDISATAGGFKETLKLVVNAKVLLSGISFKQNEYSLTVPTSGSATIEMADEVVLAPTDATNKTLTWSISPDDGNGAITVNAQGTVIATQYADTQITYTVTATSVDNPSASGQTKIKLKTATAQGITFRYSSYGSAKKDDYVYEFNYDDKNIPGIYFACEPTNVGAAVHCNFTSSDSTVATMEPNTKDDAYGELRIHGVGEALITATLKEDENISKTIKIKINESAGYVIDGLNCLASELPETIDNRNHWDYNINPAQKSGSIWYCIQEYNKTLNLGPFYENMDDQGWNAKHMPNQGNGSYVEDGGWCTSFTTWDWPFNNESANAYMMNYVHTPEGACVFKTQIRTQASEHTSGRGKFRVRLVDAANTSSQVFLDCNGQTLPGFVYQDDRGIEDKATYAGGSFDPTTGWIIIPGVPDYNIGEDYFYMIIPEEWRNKDVYAFIEVDDLYEDDGMGNMITGRCDPILVCSMAFVSELNLSDEFAPVQ